MKTQITSATLFTLLLLFIGCSKDGDTEEPNKDKDKEPTLISTPTFNASYALVADQVVQAELSNTLQTYEDFGNKQTESAELDLAQNWIEQTYQDLGYTDIEKQEFSIGASSGTNIIVTKKGTKFPDTYIIIDAHYDAIFKGTNDNGTGTVILLEAAKLLRDIDTEYSIKFIHFSGEEQGLIGSTDYVENIVIPMKLDIRLVFNIDMVGGEKGTQNVLVCEKGIENPGAVNDRSEAFTLALQTAAGLYSTIETTTDRAFGSDYVPFEDNQQVITGLYQEGGQDSAPYHDESDLLENIDMDFFTEVTKTVIGAVQHFAVAEEKAP